MATLVVSSFNAIALSVQVAVDTIAFAIKPSVDSVTFLIEPIGKSISARIGRAVGFAIEAPVDSVAALIQPTINAITLVVESFLNSIASVTDTMSCPIRFLGRGVTGHKTQPGENHSEFYSIPNTPCTHVPTPCIQKFLPCQGVQRSLAICVDKKMEGIGNGLLLTVVIQ